MKYVIYIYPSDGIATASNTKHKTIVWKLESFTAKEIYKSFLEILEKKGLPKANLDAKIISVSPNGEITQIYIEI